MIDLNLDGCQITDLGVRNNFEGMTRLERLDLDNTQITNNGLVYLASVPSLRELDLASVNDVTPDAIEAFKKALPHCTVKQ
jgi:Leucine-rich repeat (LRR) protein